VKWVAFRFGSKILTPSSVTPSTLATDRFFDLATDRFFDLGARRDFFEALVME
jgi:hypothetical protein